LGPIQSITIATLSLCLTVVCGPARADLFRDTLAICSTNMPTHAAYQSALEGVGWVEVAGSKGAGVIDRVNWLTIPFFSRSQIDRADGRGLSCYGHDLCVPTSLGRSTRNPKAQRQAFTNGESALLMYSRINDHQNGETYLTDYLSCQMISPDMAPHAELRDAVSESKLPPSEGVRAGASEFGRLLELKDFQQRETGFVLEDYSGDGLHYDGDLPWTSVQRFVFLTDPVVITDLGLEWLGYARGFSTNITHHYEGASP
jgi:hypothetical protein